jgi:capsular exopolysaccharide synthesis family protein
MSLLVPRRTNALAVAPRIVAPDTPADDVVVEETLDLREILSILRRKLLLIGMITAAVTGLAALVTLTEPPRYQANGAIRLADVRRSLTGGIEDAEVEKILGPQIDPVLSELEVLRSRSLLGQVVDSLGLRLGTGPVTRGIIRDVSVSDPRRETRVEVRFGPAQVEASMDGATGRARYGQPLVLGPLTFTALRRPALGRAEFVLLSREDAVDEVLRYLHARTRDKTDVIDVQYQSRDPFLAQSVVNGVITGFRAMNAHQAQQQSRRRRMFIEEQMQHTDSALVAAQRDLSAFRRTQKVYSSREKYAAEQAGLMGLETRRQDMVAQRATFQALLSQLQRPHAGAEVLRALAAAPDAKDNPVLVQLFTQLTHYELSRDSLISGAWGSSPNSPDVQRLNSLIASTEERVRETLSSGIVALDARLGALDQTRGQNEQQMETLPGVEAEEVRLTQQVETTQKVAEQLRGEFQKARIAEAVEAGQVEVLDSAPFPAKPIPARRSLRIILGMIVGLVLGGGGALFLEHMNNAIHRREDLERILHLASLAVIPPLGTGDGKRRRLSRGRGGEEEMGNLSRRLVTVAHFHSSGAESYRTLRTNLIFSQAANTLKRVVVSSASPGEGKSTTVCNLAVTFAQQGVRVLLIDCDLRRPTQHDVFGVPREPGLTQAVLGHNKAMEIVRSTAVENLFLVSAGTLPPNPSELLGSERMERVLTEYGEMFDLVLIDTSPVLLAPDAAILGAGADGVLLVIRAGFTETPAARQAAQQFATVGARVIGAVLNDPDDVVRRYAGYYSYGYNYTYYYGSN